MKIFDALSFCFPDRRGGEVGCRMPECRIPGATPLAARPDMPPFCIYSDALFSLSLRVSIRTLFGFWQALSTTLKINS